MSETINLGSVTAYASAVEGGYTGTYEEFCSTEANFANIAANITGALGAKADKVANATNGNFAALDANGNLKDSGHKHSDYLTSHQDISGKADKAVPSASGNVATLDANGNLTDSGKTLGKSVPSNAVFTDTKNTAGSTDSSSKLFLIGAKSQAANPQTYSQDTAYVGTDGNLYSGSKVVATQNMIGDAWVTSHAYAVGEYCIDGNVLYKCKTAHTSSASYRPPYASYWDAVTVTSQLGQGGGGGEWTLLGTLTNTWNGSNASYSSISFPSNANEIYVVLDFSKTSGSLTYRGVALIEKPLFSISSCAIQTGAWKQSSFLVMLNRSGTSNTLTMWSIYGTDGTGFPDGSSCELKVYYR